MAVANIHFASAMPHAKYNKSPWDTISIFHWWFNGHFPCEPWLTSSPQFCSSLCSRREYSQVRGTGIFYRPDILSVAQTPQVSKHWPQPVDWPHTFFNSCQSPDRRHVGPLYRLSNATTQSTRHLQEYWQYNYTTHFQVQHGTTLTSYWHRKRHPLPWKNCTTILLPLHSSTSVSRHPQLRTGGSGWSTAFHLLCLQSFTVHMPLLMATSTFGLGRRY